MTARIRIAQATEAFAAMRALQQTVDACGLERSLLELVKLRASYLNGCAYCVDMHTKDARAAGESEQRLYAVPVWRETPFFTPRERAALAWAETVTRIGDGGVDDDAYAAAREQFEERELVGAHARVGGDQRLEPLRHRLPIGGGQLPTAAATAVDEVVAPRPLPMPQLQPP